MVYISVDAKFAHPAEDSDMSVVRLDVESILELHAEQLESDLIWPYPWVQYQALKVEQKQLIRNTLNEAA